MSGPGPVYKADVRFDVQGYGANYWRPSRGAQPARNPPQNQNKPGLDPSIWRPVKPGKTSGCHHKYVIGPEGPVEALPPSQKSDAVVSSEADVTPRLYQTKNGSAETPENKRRQQNARLSKEMKQVPKPPSSASSGSSSAPSSSSISTIATSTPSSATPSMASQPGSATSRQTGAPVGACAARCGSPSEYWEVPTPLRPSASDTMIRNRSICNCERMPATTLDCYVARIVEEYAGNKMNPELFYRRNSRPTQGSVSSQSLSSTNSGSSLQSAGPLTTNALLKQNSVSPLSPMASKVSSELLSTRQALAAKDQPSADRLRTDITQSSNRDKEVDTPRSDQMPVNTKGSQKDLAQNGTFVLCSQSHEPQTTKPRIQPPGGYEPFSHVHYLPVYQEPLTTQGQTEKMASDATNVFTDLNDELPEITPTICMNSDSCKNWLNHVELRCWMILGIFMAVLYVYQLSLPQLEQCPNVRSHPHY